MRTGASAAARAMLQPASPPVLLPRLLSGLEGMRRALRARPPSVALTMALPMGASDVSQLYRHYVPMTGSASTCISYHHSHETVSAHYKHTWASV